MKRLLSCAAGCVIVLVLIFSLSAAASNERSDAVSRGEFMNILYSACLENGGISIYDELPPIRDDDGNPWPGTGFGGGAAYFSDVAHKSACFASTGWGYYHGIINGVTENPRCFEPELSLTHEQAAVILYRMAKMQGYAASGETGSISEDAMVSSWAADAVNWLSDTELGAYLSAAALPQAAMTAEEATALISNYFLLFPYNAAP